MGLYNLPPNPFQRGEYKGKPYVPHGMGDVQIANVGSFIDRAAGEDSIGTMADFIEGRGTSTTADNVGRGIFRSWFRSARIGEKINDMWDRVLHDNECTPQILIKDARDSVREGSKAEFTSTMPPVAGARSTCENDMVLAVFGQAGMGKRVPLSDIIYCMGGIWHHEWARYFKLRKKALENREDATQAYLKKRDCESFHHPVGGR